MMMMVKSEVVLWLMDEMFILYFSLGAEKTRTNLLVEKDIYE